MNWTSTIEAFNTATESTNRIHSDDIAKQYGFRGGLVPGVDVWAYLTQPCVDRWGIGFLERGLLDARFHTPVYDGETVTASLEDDGSVKILGPDGTVRATGTASIVDDFAPFPDLPTAPRSDRPPASGEALGTGTVLGTLSFGFHTEKASVYLGEVRDDREIYERGAVCHPGFLARQCNSILALHVELGPWIHVGTVARHRGLIRDGQQVEVRGVVAAEREHKGHRFVDLDVAITADGRPVYDAFHTAIWKPRTT